MQIATPTWPLRWGAGHTLAGKYRLEALLGRGGMGAVWRAEHTLLRSAVAIKIIDPAAAHIPDLLARFHREAQAAAALRSPHVVQILDYGVEDGVPYIAMELLEGETLTARLKRIGVLPYAETARIVAHIARAVGKAHELGIVHRDLKPDNVFLIRNDDEDIAKVLDFGIAKLVATPLGGFQPQSQSQTRTGSMLGTPHYMSPEQAQGTKAVDHRSDLWSLGVIAFRCVCGQVPFRSDALGDLVLKICVGPIPVPSQVASVPPLFDAWFARAACRDPNGRFQSAKEFAEALRLVLTGEELSLRDSSLPRPVAVNVGALVEPYFLTEAQTTARSASAISQAPPAPSDVGRWLAVAAGTVALAVMSAGGWWLFTRSAPPHPSTAPGARSSPPAAYSPGPLSPETGGKREAKAGDRAASPSAEGSASRAEEPGRDAVHSGANTSKTKRPLGRPAPASSVKIADAPPAATTATKVLPAPAKKGKTDRVGF